MPRARTNPRSTAAAYESQGRGFSSGYVLPPLAVMVVGTLLAVFAFNVTPQDLTAQAAAPGTPAQSPLLDTAVQAILPDAQAASPAPDLFAANPPAPTEQPQVEQSAPAPIAQSPLQFLFPAPALEAAPVKSSSLSPVFTPQVQYWSESLVRWAAAAGLDPNMAAVVMQIESCGDPSATSRSGAIGLFQVMPYHFAASDSPYDPDTNAARGLDYLRRSLATANNDARLAFAGYNGGIGVISRGEYTWPAETVRYAYWGSGIYADAISGAAESGRLNEWITAGGSGLCAHASLRLGLDE